MTDKPSPFLARRYFPKANRLFSVVPQAAARRRHHAVVRREDNGQDWVFMSLKAAKHFPGVGIPNEGQAFSASRSNPTTIRGKGHAIDHDLVPAAGVDSGTVSGKPTDILAGCHVEHDSY